MDSPVVDLTLTSAETLSSPSRPSSPGCQSFVEESEVLPSTSSDSSPCVISDADKELLMQGLRIMWSQEYKPIFCDKRWIPLTIIIDQMQGRSPREFSGRKKNFQQPDASTQTLNLPQHEIFGRNQNLTQLNASTRTSKMSQFGASNGIQDSPQRVFSERKMNLPDASTRNLNMSQFDAQGRIQDVPQQENPSQVPYVTGKGWGQVPDAPRLESWKRRVQYTPYKNSSTRVQDFPRREVSNRMQQVHSYREVYNRTRNAPRFDAFNRMQGMQYPDVSNRMSNLPQFDNLNRMQ